MAKALTTKGIEAVKPDPARRVEIPDPALSGLYLVIQPSGVKSWALRYRINGRPAKLTLGRWPLMGIAAARAAASEAIGKVEHGNDPSLEKKASKAAKLAAELTERNTIKALVELFDKRHLSGLKSGPSIRHELDRHVVAAWGARDIQSITKRDVIDLLERIVDSGRIVTANRVRAYLSKFLNWAVERDIIATNPATGVKPVKREISRDRVLSDDEVRWFWAACDALGDSWGPFGKVLLLTGQRLNEVAQMADAELNGATWHLSAARTKNGRAHDVPLSEAVLGVLGTIDRIADKDGKLRYLFTTTGNTPISGFHKARAKIAAEMEKAAAKERGEPVTIPHWTFHDLRRTAATGMARLSIPVRVTEAVLNHVSGTGGGIVAVYQRHDYAEEKRVALEAWARFVGKMATGDKDNVVWLSAGSDA